MRSFLTLFVLLATSERGAALVVVPFLRYFLFAVKLKRRSYALIAG